MREANWRKRGIDLTVAEFDAQVALQHSVCAICLKELGDHPNVDHCHETGQVRRILCNGCNLLLGHAKEDPGRLRRAIDYLSEFRERAAFASEFERRGMADKTVDFIHRRRKRYLAQILEGFEEMIEPHLDADAAGEIHAFKGLVRARMDALAHDAADLWEISVQGGAINGFAQEQKDRLSVNGRPGPHRTTAEGASTS